MVRIRRFEERSLRAYQAKKIGGFLHLYIGQEAVAVGCCSLMGKHDHVITAYRDHGHAIAVGMELNPLMAELYGKATGCSKGKGGSMHFFDPARNYWGGHGIVGGQVPLGTGLGFAHKYNEDGGVCLCYLGDGAVNQGQVYEAFNIASLWKLPVIYVIENNKYAMGTSIERSSATVDLHNRGSVYNIPGMPVDGMDVLAVKEAADKAVAHARRGDGPYILEMKTYRYRGHSMSDPAKYRTKEEVAKMREQHDPLDQLKKRLLDGGHTDEERLKALDGEIKVIVAAAAEFAQTSPEPDPSELWTDVLIDA